MADVKIKEISMETLNQAERKISVGKSRKLGMAVALMLVVTGGVYAAYRVITGDIMASRFTVTKMSCPACVITVKEITAKLPGVVEADVSLAAQDATIKFREKQITPDQIKDAIAGAGYPARLDGVFTPGGADKKDGVVAVVNGRPIFKKDISIPLYADKTDQAGRDTAHNFFSVVGKEILLQEADKNMVVVQPQEVENEIEAITKELNLIPKAFDKKIVDNFGSKEKYFQIVAQRLGLRKLIEEHVAEGINNTDERSRKTMEWLGVIFKDADVKIVDEQLKSTLLAAAGQDDWKTFWPRMIGAPSELKTALTQ